MVSKLLQSILLAVLAIAPALQGATAAPVPGSVEVNSAPIQRSADARPNGTPGTRKRRRSLAGDLAPVLGGINPLAQGLDAGLQQGAGNVKAAVQNAGATLDQAAKGVADVASNTVAGLGQTGGNVPGAVLETVKALENSDGPIGSLLNAVFGRRRGKAEEE